MYTLAHVSTTSNSGVSGWRIRMLNNRTAFAATDIFLRTRLCASCLSLLVPLIMSKLIKAQTVVSCNLADQTRAYGRNSSCPLERLHRLLPSVRLWELEE